MINVRQSLRSRNQGSDINIAPLIDLIFLLLIFFIVTTSFVKETGITVDRPAASTGDLKEQGSILIGVDVSGNIFMNKEGIDIRSVRAHVERALAEMPDAAVVIVSDKKADTGVVVEILDQCRLARAKDVSIATRTP